MQTNSRQGSRRNSRAGRSSSIDIEAATEYDDIESGTDDARVVMEQRAVQELQHKRELEQNISRMIAEVDVDGDGRINYSEFLFAMSELPHNSNFVPLTEKDVLQNEVADAMHRKRHLTRASSDGAIQQAYNHSDSRSRGQKDGVAKQISESGSIFSRFTRKIPGAKDSPRASTINSPIKSSTSYFSNSSNRNQNKVHVDIAWTKERTDEYGSLNSNSKTGSGKSLLAPVAPSVKAALEQGEHSK